MPKTDALEAQPFTKFEEETDDDIESTQFDEEYLNPRRRASSTFYVVSLALLLLSSHVFSGWLGAFLGQAGINLDDKCSAHTTQYSPVLKDVKVKYDFTNFNGSFMKEDIFRRPGSPEVDAAWEALGIDYRAGVISTEDGLRSGLSMSQVQRADKYGGGFFVNVEGMHHLHCLNLVRKSLYYNYDYYKELGTHAFANDDSIVHLHVSHCLDTLRQVLMCNVDTGVLGQVWYDKDKPAAFPDFNTRHKCKNYDAIREWAENLQAPPSGTLPNDYMKQPDDADVYPEMP